MIATLAQYFGIAVSYHDSEDRLARVQDSTLQALLGAFGVDTTSEKAAHEAATSHRDALLARCLPPVVAAEYGVSVEVVVRVPADSTPRAFLTFEDGSVSGDLPLAGSVEEEMGVGGRYVARTLDLPADLPLGYHTISLSIGSEQWQSHLIISPSFLGVPSSTGRQRLWGFATQLYSVPSRASWGIGDLADLATLVHWSGAQHGADYLLINPINAAGPLPPIEPSPYLPVSRRFFDPQYLRVEDIAEYRLAGPGIQQQCTQLRENALRGSSGDGLIDRDTAWSAKREALTIVNDLARNGSRQTRFERFLEREGDDLLRFATWCALVEVHGPESAQWPAELRDPDSSEVAQFRADHQPAVSFQLWLQWILDDQLAAVQQSAKAVMGIGVVHDLPVGVHPDGADTWAAPALFAHTVSVGAPPDAFNQLGQDWSQHPWRPDELARSGYAPFRKLVAGILRHSGGIRIDHIIGLFRLWWIPRGSPATAGSYVAYDHEVLIGIAALEAHRAGALVIGEDLGTFEPGVREYLQRRGIPGTSVLWFEMDNDAPIPAGQWREWCLASVTTHDLPPAASFVTGDHMRLRDRLALLTRPLAEELAAEKVVLDRWKAELVRTGCVQENADLAEMVEGLYRYLTLTPCRLVNVALSDAVGDRRPQNVPGTTDAYPNWRYQIADPDGSVLYLEDVLARPSVARLAKLVGDSMSAAGGTPTS